MARNDRYSYNTITGMDIDWSLDESNGKQFAGEKVQEFIKNQLIRLGEADALVFTEFANDLNPKSTEIGSGYGKIVYDATNHVFLAARKEGMVERYYYNFDKFSLYNDGTYPDAHPYSDKIYVCQAVAYMWDGEELVCTAPEASEEDIRDIVRNYNNDN